MGHGFVNVHKSSTLRPSSASTVVLLPRPCFSLGFSFFSWHHLLHLCQKKCIHFPKISCFSYFSKFFFPLSKMPSVSSVVEIIHMSILEYCNNIIWSPYLLNGLAIFITTKIFYNISLLKISIISYFLGLSTFHVSSKLIIALLKIWAFLQPKYFITI